MDQNTLYLCSDLVNVSAPSTVTVGNLELIGSRECTISVPQPIPPGTPIRIGCVECPAGKRACTDCRFHGRVESSENGPLGASIRVEFERRTWTPGQWRPRHLSDLCATIDEDLS